jgi:membrane-associated phospholipid phosphatase
VVRLVGYLCQPLKLHFDVPRPQHLSRQILPVLPTPGHGAWPAGHAAEAFAVAAVLEGLGHASSGHFSAREAVSERWMTMRIAERIAENRIIAGLHYPMDCMAGAILGLAVGEAVVNYALEAQKTPVRPIDGATVSADDFDLTRLDAVLRKHEGTAVLPKPALRHDHITPKLFEAAKAELA